MALSARLLGLDQALHVLGPLANCHWSELTCEDGTQHWRLRAHNIGSPGTVVPIPLAGPSEDAPDAEA
jgi:probable phosphoglycerate mutase